jgi:hypothetical protein
MLKQVKFICLFVFTTLLSSCGIVGDVYQEESRRIINYLLSDFPLPNDAEIPKATDGYSRNWDWNCG